MSKVKTLEKSILKERDEAADILGTLDEKIFERITYILQTIFEIYDGELDTWYFGDAAEGEVGNFNYWPNEIYNISTEAKKQPEDMDMILKDGSEFRYEGILPLRWLFEDFEEEITKGKELWIVKADLKKKKAKEAKKAREKKKQDVLAKLSLTERKLLNV